jgi:gliding motility-associated-like protein
MFTPIFTSGFDPYNFNMKIFNKWGQIIFETNSSTEGWDGTYKNNSVQTGVYNYTIEFKDKNTDKKYSLQGHVNLIK